MISYVKGTLSEIMGDVIVVEAGSVGINIHVPLTVMDQLPSPGEEVMIFTYLKVSEDALTLYGFNSRRDLDMFRQLIGVNGIGPKGALAILSTLSPEDLRMAVLTADAKAISRAPGIGLKTAQRVILDLKEKVSLEDIVTPEGKEKGSTAGGRPGPAREAMEALVQLGYSSMDAGKAVRAVEITDGMDSEAVLKEALKALAFQ